MLREDQSGVELRFPEAGDQVTMVEFLEVLEAVNDLFELVVLATSPWYTSETVPTRLAPRRYSRLAPQDRLRIARVGYGSELGVWITTAWDAVPHAVAWTGAAATSVTGAVLAVPKILDAADRVKFFREQRVIKELDLERQRLEIERDKEKFRSEIAEMRQQRLEGEQMWLARAADATTRAARRTVQVSDGEEADWLMGNLANDAIERIEERVGPPRARELTSQDQLDEESE